MISITLENVLNCYYLVLVTFILALKDLCVNLKVILMDRKLYCKRLLRSMVMVVLGLKCIISYGQNETDTLKMRNIYQPHLQINQDSINARLKFVQDSIRARQQFVRDSILRRKQILDSLTFLKGELQPVLEAIYWTIKEDIVSHADKIAIIGDSVLGDYVYHFLPLGVAGPYAPWKGSLSLNAKQMHFNIDKKTKKISTIQSPSLKSSLNYANQGTVLIIQEANAIQSNSLGKFYKIPIDSVFYDRNKRIVKIKRYMQFYTLVNNSQKGALLFTNRWQVKQYQYSTNNQIIQYEQVKFCDRYKAYDPNEVCCIITYAVAKQGYNYMISRRNNPANEFSDGTFTLEYDENGNIKGISFKNFKNTGDWQRLVELNKEGNVNCYTDKSQGVKLNTTCMIYHNEPNAKYPVEIIFTTFDKDGVSNLEKNNTTGKKRIRDKMTLEWSPWIPDK